MMSEQTDVEKEDVSRLQKLDDLSRALAATRAEAINGRNLLGIEQIWSEDEAAYDGDEVSLILKPSSIDGSFEREIKDDSRSRLSLNITRKYVDAGAAKVADMLLPTDDKNWGIKPTPLPELQDGAEEDKTPLVHPNTLEPMQLDGKQVSVGEYYELIIAEANKKSRNAESRIEDWLVECQFNSEVRKVIEATAKIGTGVLKGPFPKLSRSMAVVKNEGITSVEVTEGIKPTSKQISAWNLYPDPACGDNIHNGSYIWESDSLTERQVMELQHDNSYIQENLEIILEEGPNGKYKIDQKNQRTSSGKEVYEIWYYHGYIKKEDMEACGCECGDKFQSFPALVTMINDRVIKATVQPLDSGKFPYDVMVWSKRPDSWAGTGISRQVRTPQRMLDAVARNMMDNHALSCGPQIFIKRKGVRPADGKYNVTPRKIWYIEDDEVVDARSAIQSIMIPSNQIESMNIIQFALKMAEDVTGLPMLLQGQQGAAPETVGGMQMLNNNASTVLRRIARTFDDMLTEPHIRAYYEWLMIYGDKEEEKGDFLIEARGSSALVERDLQNQTIAQNLQLALNPAFGVDPKKAYKEYLKSQRLDYKLYEYTKEELNALQQQQQPVDPRIQAAQINNQTKIQIAESNKQETLEELRLRNAHAQAERELRLQEMAMTRDIEMLKLAQQKDMSITQIKADLAKAAMNIKNERELYAAEADLKIKQGSGI